MNLLSFFSKLSGWYRLLTVGSIVWFLVALIITDPWTRSGWGGSHNNWNEFLVSGVLPIVALWGIIWIVQGFKSGDLIGTSSRQTSRAGERMSVLRKKALAWVLSVTALAVSSLAASFVYLHDHFPTDPTYVDTSISVVAGERGFRLEDARKSGYSDEEIAAYLVKANRAEFDRLWWRILIVVLAVYVVVVFGIVATTLQRESSGSKREP